MDTPGSDHEPGAVLDAARATVAAREVFFVLGCQKSGTTWVAALLGAHPEIACRGEGHLGDLLAPLLAKAVEQYDAQGKANWKMPPAESAALMRAACDLTFARYLERCPRPERVRLLGDKTPEHAVTMPLLATLYPRARFVHVIRDGRDGAVSGWAHLGRQGRQERFSGFAAYAGYFAEHHWVPYVRAARTHGAALGDRYVEVRYETLHAQPHAEAARLLGFLGAATDADRPGIVERCVEAASFERQSGGRSRGEADPASHYRKGVVGDWRGSFDAAACDRFDAAAAGLLAELGYETSTRRAAAGIAAS